MDICFKKGTLEYLNDCEEALINSELGRRYFTKEGSGKKAILEGLEEGTLYIALLNDICVGFLFYLPKGAFHSFPLLHLIAVKEEYRSKGIGKKLLGFLEETVFLKIPNLYRKGITEYLMMKEKAE